jgi:hypothetical protein
MLGLKEWNSLLREPEPTGECSSTVDLLRYLREPFKQLALVECFTCLHFFNTQCNDERISVVPPLLYNYKSF